MNRYVAAAAIAVGAIGAHADASVIWSGSLGSRAASAEFSVSDTDLRIRLTNTSVADAIDPTDVLTGMFFDISGGSLSLGAGSAVVDAGSVVHFGATDPGDVVGGEWAYRDSLGGPGGRAYGISSSGLGLFGPGDRFPGNNLQGPTDPDGLQYGITTAGDDVTTGNTSVTGANALVKNSVVFTLTGAGAGFDLNRIDNVLFQYGTALSEPSVPGTPAPGPVALLAGAAVVALRRRRSA